MTPFDFSDPNFNLKDNIQKRLNEATTEEDKIYYRMMAKLAPVISEVVQDAMTEIYMALKNRGREDFEDSLIAHSMALQKIFAAGITLYLTRVAPPDLRQEGANIFLSDMAERISHGIEAAKKFEAFMNGSTIPPEKVN